MRNYLTLFLLLSIADAFAAEPDCTGRHIQYLEANNANIKCALLLDDSLVFPRNLVVVDGDIWLIDKGSNLFRNGVKHGKIYQYRQTSKGFARHKVLDGLEDPNDIDMRAHSDGSRWIYYTTRTEIHRFRTGVETPTPETIVKDLPTNGWHKLASILVTQNSLFVTIPSATDHCETDNIQQLVSFPCVEEETGTAGIRRYTFDGDTLDLQYDLIARGLRNAQAVTTTNNAAHLIAADNGWDNIDLSASDLEYKHTPPDEINLLSLEQTQHFGWPYCYNATEITPPYRRFINSCKGYDPPLIVLPAHSAPLAMLKFGNEILVNLHGPNVSAQRTLAYKLDSNGLPKGTPYNKVLWRNDERGYGRPLGLAQLKPKQLIVSEDWSHRLVKIVFH